MLRNKRPSYVYIYICVSNGQDFDRYDGHLIT